VRALDGRPLLLLPPSKGKAAGGDGPAYGTCLEDAAQPLAAARREVLAAVTAAVPGLGDRALVRAAGVRAGDVAMARELLLGLPEAPTLPARRRYTGVVHGNAGLAELDPDAANAEVLVVSPRCSGSRVWTTRSRTTASS
jgi:uncharacterized protein